MKNDEIMKLVGKLRKRRERKEEEKHGNEWKREQYKTR